MHTLKSVQFHQTLVFQLHYLFKRQLCTGPCTRWAGKEGVPPNGKHHPALETPVHKKNPQDLLRDRARKWQQLKNGPKMAFSVRLRPLSIPSSWLCLGGPWPDGPGVLWESGLWLIESDSSLCVPSDIQSLVLTQVLLFESPYFLAFWWTKREGNGRDYTRKVAFYRCSEVI